MIEELKLHYGAKRIIGNIPDCNRGAKLLARRLGFKDYGLIEEYTFESTDGKKCLCRKFVLEV